jgi:hypothetical protein
MCEFLVFLRVNKLFAFPIETSEIARDYSYAACAPATALVCQKSGQLEMLLRIAEDREQGVNLIEIMRTGSL